MTCTCPTRIGANSRRGLQGLGAEDRSQYDVAGNMLAQGNANLKADEAQYAANPGSFSTDTGKQLIELRNRYSTLLQAYIYAYSAAWGGAPNIVGLQYTGLGQWQVYVGAGVAIAAIAAGIYEFNQHENNLRLQMQAELTQAQTASSAQAEAAKLQEQAAAAYQSGDTQTGDQLTALANQQIAIAKSQPGSGGLTDTLKQYAGWIVAGVVGLVLIREIW